MAEITATFYIRHFENGVGRDHLLTYSENDRSALSLYPLDPIGGDGLSSPAIWISSTDEPLHDAMLMLSCLLLKDEDLLKESSKHIESFAHVELELVPKTVRLALYRKCFKVPFKDIFKMKVLLSVSVKNFFPIVVFPKLAW